MSPYFATFIDPRKTVIRQRHCRFDDHEIAIITSYNSAFSRPNGPPVWAAAGWLDHESPDLWVRHGGLSSTALWAGAERASGTTQRRASAADLLHVRGERLPAQGMVVVGARRSARLARPSPSVAPDRDAYCAGGAKAR